MIEHWKPVVGWEELFEVSDLGRVRNVNTGRIRALCTTPALPYLTIALTGVGRKRQTRYVHQLVAEAFHGPCPEGQEVRHLDGNRGNNAAANLRYGTRKENHADKRAHGTVPWGERHYRAKLTASDVVAIRACPGAHLPTLAAQYGVGVTTVHAARSGKTWANLGG